MIISTTVGKTEVLQFAYAAEVLNDFRKFCNFSISTIFYILAPRCQMGDFGRQISIIWKFNAIASILITAICLEWIGSISFSQKNDFCSVKIEQNFATESWFDGKNSPNSYIVFCKNVNFTKFLSEKSGSKFL